MKGHLCKYCYEPVWRPRRRLPRGALPAALADWLFDPGSLTRRVQASCDGQFRVDVIRQGWFRPMLNEARRLRLRNAERALIREVYLMCDERAWVYARTVIPRRTLRGPCRHLVRLGSRSLGTVLFADRSMRRDEVEVSRIEPGQFMYEPATRRGGDPGPRAIWGRRSVFYLREKPLLVCEVFLPNLESRVASDEAGEFAVGRKKR